MKANETIRREHAHSNETMKQARERLMQTATSAQNARKANAERKRTERAKAAEQKEQANTYPLVTADDALKVARASAYVAIKRAYFATYRTIKNSDGEIINYDGNAGGTEKIRNLYFGFSNTANAKRATMEEQEDAYYEVIARTDARFSEFMRKKAVLVESALKADEKAKTREEHKAVKEGLENAVYCLETEYADVINERRGAFNNFMDAVNAYAENTANDTDDCISEACLSLLENIHQNGGTVGTETAFIESVRAVHRWLYNQEKNVCVRIRTLTDEEGNILSVDEYRYIKYPHIYIEQYGTDEEGNRVLDFIDVNNEINKMVRGAVARDSVKELFAHLTEVERRLCVMLSEDYSYETMAIQILGKRKDKNVTIEPDIPENATEEEVRKAVREAREKEEKENRRRALAEEKRRQAKIRKRVERLRKKCKENCMEVYLEYLDALDLEESGTVIDWTKMI